LHQPISKTGLYIAYHYVIGGKGEIKQTRLDDEIGYHASNWPVNKTSIGICLLGNFDVEKPNPVQLFTLRDLIKKIKGKFYIKEVVGHRKYSAKTCPGKNLSDKMIEELFHPNNANI
jgi:N-acetyl-anhydromuramyl-L-alanine amidase AmpD